MRCPSCKSENLPVRETSTVVGSRVSHPSHCGECGAALTEKCPVCTYNHPVGTKFCQANGTSIEAWVSEESAWKALVQAMEATLSVRPAKALLGVILAALPGLWFMGGHWVREFAQGGPNFFHFHNWVDYVAFGIAVFISMLVATVFPMMIPMGIVGSIEKRRERKLFAAQEYKTFELK